MEDTQDNNTYMKKGKHLDYRLERSAVNATMGLKTGLRASNLTRVPSFQGNKQ